jgi:predicted Zn-dependent protease with MMP-like domain
LTALSTPTPARHRRAVTCGAVVTMTAERFEVLVGEALDSIPPDLGDLMDNVAVFVEDRGTSRYLLGLYEGVPLTERSPLAYGGMVMPDRITIYREPILRMCRTEADVVHQVLVTVVHEVAHHFGIDDDRLHELGWA